MPITSSLRSPKESPSVSWASASIESVLSLNFSSFLLRKARRPSIGGGPTWMTLSNRPLRTSRSGNRLM
jgi:hypothetical protein